MPGLPITEDLIDTALKDSFPASDPPAFAAGGWRLDGRSEMTQNPPPGRGRP